MKGGIRCKKKNIRITPYTSQAAQVLKLDFKAVLDTRVRYGKPSLFHYHVSHLGFWTGPPDTPGRLSGRF